MMAVQVKATALKVEHVFFRQKSEVHTTRSQWIVGLVLDLSIYQQYLTFTNDTIRASHPDRQRGQGVL